MCRLAPIAPHPTLAEFDHESEAALKNLATNPNTYIAIISGRSPDDAREKVKLDRITYAGNHGLEIIFWNRSRYHHEIDQETLQNYEKMVAKLEANVSVFASDYCNYREESVFHSFLINYILIDNSWWVTAPGLKIKSKR